MSSPKARQDRWAVLLAAMAAVVTLLLASFLLTSCGLSESPPPESGAPGTPSDAPKAAAEGGDEPGSPAPQPGPPKDMANGDGPGEPGPGEPASAGPPSPVPTAPSVPPEPPPADMAAPYEPPPMPAEAGFGDDKAYENGGGGIMIPGSVDGGGGTGGSGAEYPGIDDILNGDADGGIAVAPSYAPVERFPYLDAPDVVSPGQRIEVTVALTLDPLTPGVTARPGPGVTLSPEGAYGLPLPANAEHWPIDVDLVAPGFQSSDAAPLQRRIVLYRDNDSDFARFSLTLRPDAKAGVERRLAARFYHEGRFLGSAARPIRIAAADATASPSALSSTGRIAAAGAIAIEAEGDSPDMDVLVQFDDPAAPRHATVFIHSPHIAGAVIGAFDLPEGAQEWIDGNFAQMVMLGQRLRGARPIGEPASDAPEAQRRRIVALAEGFGEDLYRRYAPEDFRRVFEKLRGEGRLDSLLVSSNSPIIPWELLFAPAGDGASGGFLGLTHRIGRWTPRDGGDLTDRPGAEIVFDGVAAIAPRYSGRQALPFQQREIDALSALSGFSAIAGDYAAFEALVRDPLSRFVHFSGHGAIGDPLAGEAPFAILLEDERIDPATWRRIAGAADPARRPLYFFNACDSGAAKVTGGFVQGWGTTVLESGAAGFIGGMWPLADAAAADFAADYYARLASGLASDSVRVADVLREVRQGFYATGDPTFLAYTFYGDPNLTVVRRQP